MASASVGRGRGEDLAVALGRLGTNDTKAKKHSSLAFEKQGPDFAEITICVVLSLKSPSTTNLEALRKLSEDLGEDEEAVTKLVQAVYNNSLNDRDWASNSGEVLNFLVVSSVNGRCVRTTFLKVLQKSFKNREELCSADFNRYLSLQTLLCSMFKWLKVDEERLKPLTGSVYQVVEELLDGRAGLPPQREEEVETFHKCILMVGGLLENGDKMLHLAMELQYISAVHNVFVYLIIKKTSPKMRYQLLETLDYHITGNWSRENEMRVYYGDLLSDVMAENR